MYREISKTRIQYCAITPDDSYFDSIFYIRLFSIIRDLPQDLNQLIDSIEYFESLNNLKILGGIDLYTFLDTFFSANQTENKKKFWEYSNHFNDSLVKVFIIDVKSRNHSYISEFIKSIPFSFYTIIGNDNFDKTYNPLNYFKEPIDLINLLRDSSKDIAKKVGDTYRINWEINKEKSFFYWNPIYKSSYTLPNYYLLNQIIGNYWIQDYKEIERMDFTKGQIKPNERTTTILKQVKRLDAFTTIRLEQELFKPVLPFQPAYAPLILVAPYHFPRLDDLIKPNSEQKEILNIYHGEQSIDYTFKVSINDNTKFSNQEIVQIIGALDENLRLFENVGYLHSLFSYSPILRLPLIGASINLELSNLESSLIQPDIHRIERFGKKLSGLILDKEISDYLLQRNGQIVILSDLPLEWMYLDKYPICFTHDVCRIPIHNTNSLINCYIQNQRFSYAIPRNLIKKTLLIHCSSVQDQSMRNSFDFLNSFKKRLGFESVLCSTIEEIKEAVSSFKPDLLIFDCHGYSNTQDFSSYLVIDETKEIVLSGDDIIKHNISAPIVFLSACKTMPNYGYIRFLSDAFMQVGAFVVTSTFNPIKINSATTFLYRLLNKIYLFQEQIIHTNWLEFISHLCRSDFVTKLKLQQLENNPINPITDTEFAEFLTRIMSFHERQQALEEMIEKFNERNDKKIDFSNFEIDWMLYTTIGRADLIYFQSWLEKSVLLNGNNQ